MCSTTRVLDSGLPINPTQVLHQERGAADDEPAALSVSSQLHATICAGLASVLAPHQGDAAVGDWGPPQCRGSAAPPMDADRRAAGPADAQRSPRPGGAEDSV